METKRKEVDYNYYHKIMRKLFPTYNYNPQLMGKPSADFVFDIMELFTNYFDDLTKQLPSIMNNPENRTDMHEDAFEYKSIPVAWQLLSKCNRLLREFNFGSEGPELFAVGDIINPNNLTVNKIMFVLNICFHIHELDFTEAHEQIQQILAENASIQDPEVLIKQRMDLEVASECLQHKLSILKGKEEMERLYNAEVVKCEAREKERQEEIDAVRSTLLQRRNELKKRVRANKNLQDKLVDESVVENLKSELDALKLNSKNQMIEGENLISKIINSKSSKELLEYQLNIMQNSKGFLKKQKEYLTIEDELKEKLDNILRENADLKIQITNCKKERSVVNDLDDTFDDWKENFQINKAKLQADIAAEETKQDELQSDIDKTSAQVEKVLIDMEKKHTHLENLATSIKEMDTEVKMVLDTMLKQTLKRCED